MLTEIECTVQKPGKKLKSWKLYAYFGLNKIIFENKININKIFFKKLVSFFIL